MKKEKLLVVDTVEDFDWEKADKVLDGLSEPLQNYARTPWMDIPAGGQWRYEVRNLTKGYDYYANITAVSEERSDESSAINN